MQRPGAESDGAERGGSGAAEHEEGYVRTQQDRKLCAGLDLVGKRVVAVDPRYYRPAEVETLLGNPAKAKKNLGWEPKITLDELVNEMVEVDLELARRDSLIKRHGYQAFAHHE